MKYTIYFLRQDDREPDAQATVVMNVECNSPPSRIIDFVGGDGLMSDGYSGKEYPFSVESDPKSRGVILAYHTNEGRPLLHQSDDLIAPGQRLWIEGDECSYMITRISW